jgi:hypothetical protein
MRRNQAVHDGTRLDLTQALLHTGELLVTWLPLLLLPYLLRMVGGRTTMLSNLVYRLPNED